MRLYKLGAHTKTDLKVHLIWIPKYRKRVLTGPVATRARDVLRQIALEHEIEIFSGKVSSDHIHMFISYRPNSKHQQEHAVVERNKLAHAVVRISTPEKAVLGPTSLGTRVSCRKLR